MKKTIVELIECAASWENGVRLLGNVKAGDMVIALTQLLKAVN